MKGVGGRAAERLSRAGLTVNGQPLPARSGSAAPAPTAAPGAAPVQAAASARVASGPGR